MLTWGRLQPALHADCLLSRGCISMRARRACVNAPLPNHHPPVQCPSSICHSVAAWCRLHVHAICMYVVMHPAAHAACGRRVLRLWSHAVKLPKRCASILASCVRDQATSTTTAMLTDGCACLPPRLHSRGFMWLVGGGAWGVGRHGELHGGGMLNDSCFMVDASPCKDSMHVCPQTCESDAKPHVTCWTVPLPPT